MANRRRMVRRAVARMEKRFDLLKYRLREHRGGRNPIMITAYRGYGTPNKLYLKGRVLEDRRISVAAADASTWTNFVNMIKRFKSFEIPFARVLARFGDIEQEVVADLEGFFELKIELDRPLTEVGRWHEIELELLKPRRRGYDPVRATGQVFVVPPDAQFGVISDIDDTVLFTNATNVLRMARTVFLSNARMRLPFPGVAAFYRALLTGTKAKAVNPLLYVSSAPWNLYDLLCEFFHIQDIPHGPMLFLRNWGLSEDEFLPLRHRPHKLKLICQMLDFFPDLPFVLIGDSGQEDPEIYTEVVGLYPSRIQAIYIRNVKRRPSRIEAIRALARQVTEAGSTLVLADDTLPLAQHAAEHGWISKASLPEIVAAAIVDEMPDQTLGPVPETKEEVPAVVLEGGSAAAAAIDEGAIERALETERPDGAVPVTVRIGGMDDNQAEAGDEG